MTVSFFIVLLVKTVFLIETVNTSIGLGEPLFAGVERVAIRASINTDFFEC